MWVVCTAAVSLSIELGGNVEGSQIGTQVTDGGVTVIGAPYLASEVSTTASNLLSRNVADVLAHFLVNGRLEVRQGEELDDAMVVAHTHADSNDDKKKGE